MVHYEPAEPPPQQGNVVLPQTCKEENSEAFAGQHAATSDADQQPAGALPSAPLDFQRPQFSCRAGCP